MSESQKTFNFHIAGETKGPLTEDEARALIASGEITPETLCAPVGATEWEAASKHLNFGAHDGSASGAPSLKSAVPAKAPAATAAQHDDSNLGGPELAPHLRKKLIKLGLATATTIDNFNEAQAVTAISAYETGQRKAKNARIWGGIGGFAGGALATLVLCLTPLGTALAESIAGNFIHESESYTKKYKDISSDFTQFRAAQRDLEEAKLKEPADAQPGTRFRDRVQVPQKRQNLLRVTVDFSALSPALRQSPRILYFSQFPADIKKRMLAQTETALKYKEPGKLTEKLDETELAASWELYKKECGNALAEFAKANETARVEIEDVSAGEWRIEGRQTSNLAIATDLRLSADEKEPLTVFLPINTALNRNLTKEEWFEVEQYVVLEKKNLGGKTYGISGTFQRFPYSLEKTTPALCYLRMRQDELSHAAAIWVRVPEELYNKTSEGAKIPTKKLAEFSFHTSEKPREYSIIGKPRFKETEK